MATDKNLKSYVRLDGQNRVVAGSLIFRQKKPTVGKWKEIPSSICCTTTTTTIVPTTTTTTTIP